MDELEVAKAVASRVRLDILGWLRDPARNFESEVEGDLGSDGVCVNLIASKAVISQPTASRHLSILKNAGLVKTRRVAQRNYHRRDEEGIDRAKRILIESL